MRRELQKPRRISSAPRRSVAFIEQVARIGDGFNGILNILHVVADGVRDENFRASHSFVSRAYRGYRSLLRS